MEWTAGFAALGFGIGKDLEGDSPGVGREVSLSLMIARLPKIHPSLPKV